MIIPVLALLSAPVNAGSEELELYAGQHTLVGSVTIANDGDAVSVTYTIDDPGWIITETHVYADTIAPQRHAPGRFPYGDSGVQATELSYDVEVDATCDDTIYVAAHAVVQEVVGWTTDIEDFELSLPDQVTMRPYRWIGAADSYWDIVVSNGGDLDGTYDGWCVDVDRTMSSGATYTADVVSSTEDTTGLVDHPENFDQVNWILNQDYVGQASSCGGAYTFGDVQRAIWTLVDHASTNGLGSWSACRVDEILAASGSEGAGFEPGCGDVAAVLLVPVSGSNQVIIAQITIIGVGAGCDPVLGEGQETAWAYGGIAFPRARTWATYTDYTLTCD